MKTKIKRHSRSVISVILAVCMLVSCMTVGMIATDAARVTGESVGGNDWQGNSFFRVPDSWDLETYPYVQAWAVQSTSASSGTKYAFCLGNMSIVGTTSNSRLYFLDMNTTGHGDWASEYLAFTANTSNWDTGNFYISTCGQYTAPLDFNPNHNSGSYLFTPSDDTNNTAANNNTMSGSYNETKRDVLKKDQDFYVTTDGSASAVGGSLTVDAYYENGTDYSGSSAIATSSITVNTSDSNAHEKYEGTVEGTKVTLTATANSGYTFAGFYDAATGGNLISATSPATYYVYGTKSVYARFTNSSGDASTFSLTGDIWSSCITQINGSTNTITRGEGVDDATWWGEYHAGAAVNTATGTAGEYYIDITTADRATLVAGNPTFTTIDIGLYKKNVGQKAFKVGDTYYNYIGGDYKVTSAGLTDADIVDLAASNGGGSLKLQPGRSYRITINENTNKISVSCTSGDKYFLAGQYTGGVAQFFGSTWNTSNNELTYNSTSGCYEKTFTTNIPADTINFKVVKNGDSDGWDGGSWPTDGNQSYVIKANATSVTFSYNPTSHVTTVTQVNSGGSGDGTWPPTDTEVTNITGSSTSTSKYILISNNDNFDDNGSNKMTAVALEKKYLSGNNTYYWADLTNYMSYGTIHAMLSRGSLKSDAANLGTASKVNSGGFPATSVDEKTFTSGSTNLFSAKGAVRDSVYHRVEIYNKHSSLTHIGVVIRTNHGENGGEANNWVEYGFYYTDYTAPVVETQVVDIYAKDATLRDDTFNRFARLATTTIDSSDAACFEYTDEDGVTYSSISDYNTAKDPDIVITRESYGGTDAGYTKMTNVPVGAKVKIKTTLSSNSSAQGSFDNKAFKETHYVKGYSFNGVTYQINEWESDGVYEEIWTVRAVNTTYKDSNDVLQNATTGGNVVEVTPIYYMKDNTNCKTFYIDGYDGTVQNAWGNMLAVYPYYEGKSNKDNAFGGYPGQPMLLWGGKYQMEIPLTVDGTASGASVKGLTLHNAYWDLLHRSIDIRCNARNHAQTYDYDDFYKLYKEKNPDTIIFDFKYRTTEDNYNDGYDYTRYTFADGTTKHASDYTGDSHNGVEIVTDYFGRQVDAFGNLIADANKSHYGEDNGSGGTVGQSNEILFVSTGYKDTYVGEYATIWAVYQSNGTFIGYISSSMLYLNSIDRRLQYTGGDSTASGRMSWSNFISTYNTLKSSYTGVPALIVYDREIWNDSKDKANRSDGKWYYSNKSDKISASIKIQYGAYSLFEAPDHSVSSDAWNDDPFNQSKTGVGGYNNIGTNTGCSAYFTNTTPNLNGKVASGEQFADSTKKFTFQAVPSGSYMFAGWVRYSNGKYYKITENEIGESPMSSNDVYIARFVTAKTGSLTVQHVVEQTNEYNGTGTPALTVTVKDGSGNNVSGSPFSVSDGSKIDISKWIDARNATYTINISLTTTPTNESFMKNIASSSGNYAASPNTWNASYDKTNSSGANTEAQTATVARFTVQQILDSGITSLRYVSHLMKPVYTYQYEIVYTYTSRFWGTQSYTQTGTCEDGDFTGSKTTAKLTTDFIIGKTPYEKSFRQQIDWNYTTTAVPAASGTGNVGASAMENNVATDQGSNTYKMTAHVYASKTVNDKVTAEFVLPYKYNEKAQGYTVKDTDVYNSSGTKSGTSYLYDSGNESVTLSTKAYSLFTYDDENHTGSDDIKASSLPLMEAAPYLMTNLGDNDYHYKLTDNIRYYTGNSFKVGDTTYYKSQADVPQNPGKYEVLTSDNSVTFRKIKYQPDGQQTTYHFAVEDTSGGAKGEYGYKIYFFSYVRDDDTGAYKDNDGNPVEEPIFNGQYCVYSVGREKDGIIEGTGVKKYFTRWDVYNTKGDFVASCYNRRFNYSGYDNYVIKPIYDSDTENNYASSLGTDIGSSITYLDDSRNQWNNGASGDYNRVTNLSDANYAGDKIFTDFAITYAYEGRNINTVSSDEAKIRVGMVIEKLDALDTVGSTTISDASYYANKYKGDTDWEALSTALAGGTSLTTAVRSAGGASSAGHSCFNSKIASNYDETGYTRFGNPAPGAISGQESVVDNFNRLQWFYTFNNSTKTTAEADTVEGTMKNYAFRAISYIIVEKNGTKTATLTDTPVYFTIYDTATRAHN